MIRIVKCHPDAVTPKYATPGSAGFDLHVVLPIPDVLFEPGRTHLLHTGLQMAIPKGYELQIRSRSGMALKGLVVVNSPGTIDSDYRGEIKVMIRNITDGNILIKHLDRIAQAVLAPVVQAEFLEVSELDTTERGQGGFGSTGC